MKGFSYQMSDFRKKLTLTIFSAPNYCDTYKNKGGIAIINVVFLIILERIIKYLMFYSIATSICFSKLYERNWVVFSNYSNKSK